MIEHKRQYAVDMIVRLLENEGGMLAGEVEVKLAGVTTILPWTATWVSIERLIPFDIEAPDVVRTAVECALLGLWNEGGLKPIRHKGRKS